MSLGRELRAVGQERVQGHPEDWQRASGTAITRARPLLRCTLHARVSCLAGAREESARKKGMLRTQCQTYVVRTGCLQPETVLHCEFVRVPRGHVVVAMLRLVLQLELAFHCLCRACEHLQGLQGIRLQRNVRHDTCDSL